MSRRSLALVANFHRERRIGRKTANFLGHVQGRLRDRGIDFKIEFVLDRPDEATVAEIEKAALGIADSRVHQVDFGNLGSSRTFGVEAARADVVCFTDGDDFFSLDWFEGALDFFSGGQRRVVLHTQYMVGFDHEQFIRETTQSIDPHFDPLALAVDWYWSANLAVQTGVFASAPIQPYDHASGFGSEDWHWSCNSLAAGIERVSLPGACYYYRVKPDRFALGKVSDVIHMASPLFEAARLPPPPPAPSVASPSVAPLSSAFFVRAREVEAFELGVSWLRSLEAGARQVRHFKPHTPPIVGDVVRGVLASGFSDGSLIVFADSQRLAGGMDRAASLGGSLTNAPSERRLYVIDGDQEPSQGRADGYEIHLGALRSAGLYQGQIDRLLARFLIQHRDLTVLTLLSSRTGSPALAFSRATRGSVARWINLILDYGFDALSQAYDELDLFAAAGIGSENIAVFGKTAVEAWAARGIDLIHDPALEAACVAGASVSLPSRFTSSGRTARPRTAPGPSLGATAVVRLRAQDRIDGAGDLSEGPWLTVDAAFRDLAALVDELVFVGGDTFLGEGVRSPGLVSHPGLRIPALSVIHQGKPPAFYFRPSVDSMNEDLRVGGVPADLAWAGAIGVDGATVRGMLRTDPVRLSVCGLMSAALFNARAAGVAGIGLFASNSVVSVGQEDLEHLGGARLTRGLSRWLARGFSHG